MRLVTVTFDRKMKDWVVQAGAEVLDRHERKQVSILQALAYAKENFPVKVVIHKKSGQVEEERLFDSKPLW